MMDPERYGAWPHQVESLEKAQAENIILNMPTGTGKTLVACMLLDFFKGYLSLFVVNSRALVPQQAEYLRKHSLKGLQVETMISQSASLPDVLVATGEVIRSALESGEINPQQVACVVLDEAHYAVGKHPYAEIMSLLERSGACPRILGLTASFFHGRAKMGCERRLEGLEELLRAKVYCPKVALESGTPQFFTVPWRQSCRLAEIASFEQKLEERLASFRCENWEFQKCLESEKTRLRGVLEALGSAGWRSFLCDALPEVMAAKLQSKLSIVEDEVIKSNLQAAIAMLQPFQLAMFQTAQQEQQEQGTVDKFETLLTLLQQLVEKGSDKILVFVERVSVACCMARLLSSRLGLQTLHVAGVQGMDAATRQSNLTAFKTSSRLLVATSSLEEGLDVPSCRYVIRYDSFSSAKSHVQGAGRARHPEAEVYYFENDPSLEEGTREFLESIARREEPGTGGYIEPTATSEAKQSIQEKETTPGVGIGHKWGAEETMWDFQNNKSFRGMTCPCGARLRIVSRAYGQGRKKKERLFSVEGPVTCLKFSQGLDARFRDVDPTTGSLKAWKRWNEMIRARPGKHSGKSSLEVKKMWTQLKSNMSLSQSLKSIRSIWLSFKEFHTYTFSSTLHLMKVLLYWLWCFTHLSARPALAASHASFRRYVPCLSNKSGGQSRGHGF